MSTTNGKPAEADVEKQDTPNETASSVEETPPAPTGPSGPPPGDNYPNGWALAAITLGLFLGIILVGLVRHTRCFYTYIAQVNQK